MTYQESQELPTIFAFYDLANDAPQNKTEPEAKDRVPN